MAEYTPTTEQVRAAFIAQEDFYARVASLEPPTSEESSEDFDRWLAAHDAELRAEVERLRGVERGWQHDRAEWERERDEARQQLADLRARCSECGPGYRVGDEGCRHRPAPVVPDSAGVRSGMAARIAFEEAGARLMATVGSDATRYFDALARAVAAGATIRDVENLASLAAVGQGVTAECDHARAARDLVRSYPGSLADATALVEAFAQADRATVRPDGQEGV